MENGDTIAKTNSLNRSSGKIENWAGDLSWMHAFLKKGRTLIFVLSTSLQKNNNTNLQSDKNMALNKSNV